MPFGCFGKRKKKEKSAADGDAGNDCAPVSGPAGSGAADAAKNGNADIGETVVAARSQGAQSAAAPGLNIQKSATLARYDFLRKSDFVNSADRWAALKEQYLAPKMTQSQHGGHLAPPEPSSAPPAATNGPPTLGPGGGRGRTAQSLPRQFSPPSTVVSVVKFSHWFYERQVKEEEARREAQEREEKSRKVLEGQADPPIGFDASAIASSDSDVTTAAAEIIQAGYRGFKTRQLLQEQKQKEQQQQQQQKQKEAEEEQEQHEQHHEQHEQQHEQTSSVDQHPAGHLADEEAAAAARIQAGFRGYQTRKHLAESREHEHEQNQKPDQHNQEQQQQHHPASDHHLVDDIDENDPRVNAAATKIQAGFKGMQARKEVKELRKHKDDDAAAAASATAASDHHAEADDNHPHDNQLEHSAEEMNAAAVKIQAGFKGYKTRKEMGRLHDHHESEHPHEQQQQQQPHEDGAES